MITEIDSKGWEIGLHPTWYTYDDVDELNRQKAALENIISDDIRSVRQHYLHYDPHLTPQAHHEAGFEFDSTLGFNKNIGFRRGSSYPWNVKDLHTGEKLDTLEIPLVIQDTALFRDRGLGLNKRYALDYVEMLADEVAETGGVLTLSWHPSNISKDMWFEVYREALEMLDDKKGWFGSVQEVGEKWLEYNSDIGL